MYNKQLINILIIFSLILTICNYNDTSEAQEIYDNILYVGGSGEGNYSRIQDAIDNASDGDTIYVYVGVYYEHIIIYKQILLIGEDKVNTIIDGGGNNSIYWENIIRITDDNVQINGLTLRNLPGHTDDGISCENYDNICIENCIIHTCYNGINMLNSENVNITNNTFYNNNHIQNYFFSKNHIIQGCTFSDSDCSISFDVENGVIKNCLFSNIAAWSIIVSGNNSLVENNSFLEVGQSIRISQGTNITCRNNIIENSQGGISFSSCSGNLVTNNIITNVSQWWGCITLNHATLNYISGNIIMDNDIGPGIGLSSLSYNNTIFENCISNCEVGFKIHYEANNNEFFHNNLINNIQNAYDEFNNTWDNGYPWGGNYWDDYLGEDIYHGPDQDLPGCDGIGDTPYDIIGGNQDKYPLMRPYQEDNEPPNIEIISPRQGFLYFLNREICPFFITLIIGKITIEVNTSDDQSGVDKVEFYIDNDLMETDFSSPFSFTWDRFVFFKHTIKAVSYDIFGNNIYDIMEVWRFF